MIIDLIHNKIVASTITEAFEKSVKENLVPALVQKYGDTEIVGIQMYEDYLSDGFMKNGYWYYPLTVVTADGVFTEWVKWAVSGELFDKENPYAYLGEENIDFKITENVPEEFENKLVGRARFCEGGLIKLCVETTASDITKLSGKYSQTFIDELARQITAAIGSAMSVEGLDGSSIVLSLVFASGTYMEHISENITYRRLVLSDGASAPRDFWIKWTRLDGAVAYSVADDIGAENIIFELGEDVSQKIREKEYRYLVSVGKDKYHNAMGRKNVTEWREIVKRAIRRGELVKVEQTIELAPETRELEEKLADVLGRAGVAIPEKDSTPDTAAPAFDDEFERAMQKMREVANSEASDDDAEIPEVFEEVAAIEEAEAEEETEAEAAETAEETDIEAEEEAEELLCDDETDVADISDELSTFDAETDDTEAEADSDEIVFDASDDSDEAAMAEFAPTPVEFFEEEEDEEEEELDELEAFYAESEFSLDTGVGAVASNDEEEAELEEITRLALEALAEARERAAETADKPAESVAEEETVDEAVAVEEAFEEDAADEDAADEEFLDFTDDEALEEEAVADEEEEETLAELRLLEPDEIDEESPSEELAEAVADDADTDAIEETESIESETEILPEILVSPEREQDIRAEIEARIRLEYESRARKMAEEETARLRREQETMRIENERLLAEARREQERIRAEYEKLLSDTERLNAEREAMENARRAEEDRLRAQIEAQLRQEARERERLAEAARMAIEEQRRLEEENARRELERAAEEKRIEQERLQREAEARAVAERAAEAERIRREEEAARAAAAAAMPTVGDGNYSYTSKVVKFIFRKSVDPNITTRIHEIIKATIEYYGKDKVFLKIRASVPDSQSVILEFVQIPIEEMELLGNIIKILGNSGIGIAKAIVE